MSKLTHDKFTVMVEARAKERVRTKHTAYRLAVTKALNEFAGTYIRETAYITELPPDNPARKVVEFYAKGRNSFPKELLDRERELVIKELFSTMDEMQRAYLAHTKEVPADAPTEEGE